MHLRDSGCIRTLRPLFVYATDAVPTFVYQYGRLESNCCLNWMEVTYECDVRNVIRRCTHCVVAGTVAATPRCQPAVEELRRRVTVGRGVDG